MDIPMVPNKITVHCADTKNGEEIPIETIKKWHTDPVASGGRGWPDIGYHMVIYPDGSVENGRPLNVQGFHVHDHNDGNVGICLEGSTQYSVAQFDSLRSRIDSLIQIYNIPRSEIYCHYQWDSAQSQGKTCPNIPINTLLCWYFTHDMKVLAPYLLTSP